MGRIAGFPPELTDKMRLGQIGPGGQLPHGQRLGIPGLHQTDDGRAYPAPALLPRPGGIPQQPIKQRRRADGGPQFKLARLLRLQAEDFLDLPDIGGGIYRREEGRPAGGQATQPVRRGSVSSARRRKPTQSNQLGSRDSPPPGCSQ